MTLRIAEVHLHIRRHREVLEGRHLHAAVPRQRMPQLTRQRPHTSLQCLHHRLGVLRGDLHQDREAGTPLHQRRDVGVARSVQQIAFPVPGHRTVLRRGRPLADRNRVLDGASAPPVRRRVLRATHQSARSQMTKQLLLQHASGLHKQALVDRLVGYLHLRIMVKFAPQPLRDLLRRPVFRETLRHQRPQPWRPLQQQSLGRLARLHVARSESSARYRVLPPFRDTSRLTVEAGRPRRAAMERSESPAARPREISSRSESVSRRDGR